MSSFIDSFQGEFDKVIDFLEKEINSLRGARASSSLVENIMVEVYGTKMALKEVAGIHLEGHKSIVIEPWDKTNLKIIEKAIFESSLNVSPTVDSQIIRINFPPLNEEKRKEIIKILHQKAEHARVGLRGVRDEVKENISEQEENKEISEDDRFRLIKELDEKIGELNDLIKEKVDKKEKELMEI
jgi:ribosome recycling factor